MPKMQLSNLTDCSPGGPLAVQQLQSQQEGGLEEGEEGREEEAGEEAATVTVTGINLRALS